MKNAYSLKYFSQTDWSFVLLKKEKIVYKSKNKGLQPLIYCIKKYRREMRGGIVFDKIVGRAAAILLAYAKVSEVWTPLLSKAAKTHLTKNKIKFSRETEIECVMNRDGADLCPMEKMTAEMLEYEFIAQMLGHHP